MTNSGKYNNEAKEVPAAVLPPRRDPRVPAVKRGDRDQVDRPAQPQFRDRCGPVDR
jgi:hypothetical protein